MNSNVKYQEQIHADHGDTLTVTQYRGSSAVYLDMEDASHQDVRMARLDLDRVASLIAALREAMAVAERV